MHDPPLAPSAGGSHQCGVKAPGALLNSKSIGRQWLFTASPVDGEIIAGSPATIAASARVNLAAHSSGHPSVQRAEASFYIRNRGLWPGHLFQPGPSTLPVAVPAVPLAWRRQW